MSTASASSERHRSRSRARSRPSSQIWSPHAMQTAASDSIVQDRPDGLHRIRNAAAPNMSTSKPCVSCKTPGEGQSYCSVCNANFCFACWDQWPLHGLESVTSAGKLTLSDGISAQALTCVAVSTISLSSLGVPHEKLDPSIAAKIRTCLRQTSDEEVRIRLHEDDGNTNWFGVSIDPYDDTPVFEDTGRFAYLLAETSSATPTSRFPGLVSFIGQTGAGKSTLIKVLIELQNSTNQAWETPVVGSPDVTVSFSLPSS